jgi:spoIIIJ-associated protein
MEWVETTGRTVEEAKDLALDQLGVDEQDAEFEVLEEPRPGLFGRIRGEARVRARVRPTRPRPKVERRERRRKPRDGAAKDAGAASGNGSGADDGEGADDAVDDESQEDAVSESENGGAAAPVARERQDDGPAAAAFLEGLAAAFGTPATAEIDQVGEDEVEVRLEGDDLGLLIGPRGQTLLAVQDLTRLAVQRRGESTGRLRIDVAGYRQRRREALARFTEQVAREVVETGTARALEPMPAADRKVVHDTANGIDGVTTASEGEEPFRCVVLRPSDG